MLDSNYAQYDGMFWLGCVMLCVGDMCLGALLQNNLASSFLFMAWSVVATLNYICLPSCPCIGGALWTRSPRRDLDQA